MQDYLEILLYVKNRDNEPTPQEVLDAFLEDQQDGFQ